jgi:hypothetical protein
VDWNGLKWTGVDFVGISWEFRGTFRFDNQGVKKEFGNFLGITT